MNVTILPDLIDETHVWDGERGNFHHGRDGASVKMLIIHDTEGSLEGARQRFRNVNEKVSAHYFDDRDGNIYQEVKEEDTAYHAGESAWGGYINVNNVSIGIELVKTPQQTDYTQPQYDALVALSKQIIHKYNIPPEMVARHKDVATPPGRKQDPVYFPWAQFKIDIYSDWQAWGTNFPLPMEQRTWGIPSAWYQTHGKLGKAVSSHIYWRLSQNTSVQYVAVIFEKGIIYGRNPSGPYRILVFV